MASHEVVAQKNTAHYNSERKTAADCSNDVLAKIWRHVEGIEKDHRRPADDRVADMQAVLERVINPNAALATTNVSGNVAQRLADYAHRRGIEMDDALKQLLDAGQVPAGVSADEENSRLAIAGQVVQGDEGFTLQGGRLAIEGDKTSLQVELDEAQAELAKWKKNFGSLFKVLKETYPDGNIPSEVTAALDAVAHDPAEFARHLTERDVYRKALVNIGEVKRNHKVPLNSEQVVLWGKLKQETRDTVDNVMTPATP